MHVLILLFTYQITRLRPTIDSLQDHCLLPHRHRYSSGPRNSWPSHRHHGPCSSWTASSSLQSHSGLTAEGSLNWCDASCSCSCPMMIAMMTMIILHHLGHSLFLLLRVLLQPLSPTAFARSLTRGHYWHFSNSSSYCTFAVHGECGTRYCIHSGYYRFHTGCDRNLSSSSM